MARIPSRAATTTSAVRRCLAAVAAASIALTVAGCGGATPSPGPSAVVDLLQEDWRLVPGVTPDGDELRVVATGSRIVEQDGSGEQANPPVVLAGTHLVAAGDFMIGTTFADVSGDATLSVYDHPPVIADELRIEPAGRT